MDVTPNIYGADGSSANARRGLLCCVLVATSSRAQATRGETIQCRDKRRAVVRYARPVPFNRKNIYRKKTQSRAERAVCIVLLILQSL